jgi:HTH-type transcriptional regulator/antitoxin HigA
MANLAETRPPGEYIKDELEHRGWSQRDLAFVLGQTEQQLSPLLSGKRAISADMARLLGDAFNIDPQFFANLQSEFDLSRAKVPDPSVKTRAVLQNDFPVRDMIRRGWIQEAAGSLLQLQVEAFFEVANDDRGQALAFAAKRTHQDSTTPAQAAWVYRVRQLARIQNVPVFSPDRLLESIERLHSLMIHPPAVDEVAGLLIAAGVRLVLVEALPGSKIDGVCTWLSDDQPVIGLSTFYDRIDNFWFVLRHEIEHVLRGDGKVGIGMVDDLSETDVSSEAERIANQAAADFCISETKFRSFYARKAPYFSEKDVIGFAAVNSVHPGIVVGRLQRELKRYDLLKRYQVPVRRFFANTVPMDGWGNVANTEMNGN